MLMNSNITIKKQKIASLTWFKAGGECNLFKVNEVNELQEFLKNNKEKFFVLGAGSNILIRDGGIDEIVIKFGRNFNYLEAKDNIITAGASVLLPNLARFALENNLSGLEFYTGIPGTVGGGLAMNAG